MNLLGQKVSRVKRIPGRLRRDSQVIRLLKNWREVMAAELAGRPIRELRLRNGTVLTAPEAINLWFLFHEIWVREAYNQPGYEIHPGDTVIDIGGNIGVYATYAATRAPGVKVYTYEPFPENAALLRENVERSGLSNVKVHQQAVAGAPGTRTLRVCPENWEVHALTGDGVAAPGVSVESISLDGALEANGIESCDLMKMDCEGAEYEILQNCAPGTLGRVRRIVMEYHQGGHIAGTGEELCRFLEGRSFRVDMFKPMAEGCGMLYASNTRG